jgi:hypothetical protein
MSAPTTVPIIPEGQVKWGVGENGAPVYVSRQIILIHKLHTRYIDEGGDIRPLLALLGYPRYAAFLEEGHRLLREVEASLMPDNHQGLMALPNAPDPEKVWPVE